MEIIKGIGIIDTCLLIDRKILVIADLHIGYEEALAKQGIFAPRSQFKETEENLKKIFKKTGNVETIIINGDLKHEFREISQQEWKETIKIFDLMQKYCKRIILVRGNHDKILGPIAEKKGLEVKDYYCIKDICILHGDKIIQNLDTNKAKILIIGHEHPAITLHEGMKQENYKCFLLGKWKKQKLIVMPSFFPLIEGTDILKEEILSPYLHQNLRNFEAFIAADKIYKFGKLKNIK
jgi:hypothetical protein